MLGFGSIPLGRRLTELNESTAKLPPPIAANDDAAVFCDGQSGAHSARQGAVSLNKRIQPT